MYISKKLTIVIDVMKCYTIITPRLTQSRVNQKDLIIQILEMEMTT